MVPHPGSRAASEIVFMNDLPYVLQVPLSLSALSTATFFTADVSGVINQQAIHILGRGVILENEGLTKGEYDIRQWASETDPRLLVAIMITGYPNACTETRLIPNPFRNTSYEYRRTLTFGTGDRLEYTAAITLIPGRLDSTFKVTGSAPPFRSSAVRRIVERWGALKNGSMSGAFNVEWTKGTNVVARADAASDYKLPPDRRSASAERILDIDAVIAGNKLTLAQSSHLRALPASA
jgi:hypothetical protein